MLSAEHIFLNVGFAEIIPIREETKAVPDSLSSHAVLLTKHNELEVLLIWNKGASPID